MLRKFCSWSRRRSFALGALVTYVFLVIAATLLSRQVSSQAQYTLKMFWSFYDYWTGANDLLLMEVIMNIVMFVPVGFLMPCVLRDFRYRKTAAFSLGFTILIESCQLVLHRGLFEFDDIIHNFLGACIGMLLFIWLLEKNRKYAKRMLLFIFIYGCCYAVILFLLHWMWTADAQAAKAQMQETVEASTLEEPQDVAKEEASEETDAEEPPYESPIDFEALWQQNPDIIGWIRVPGTEVDYPILRSGEDMDTDYYLNHNLDGSAGYPGCIYMQKVNAPDFSDQVTVLYGHNMRDGSMFSALHRYENGDFWEDAKFIYIYLPDCEYQYQVYLARDFDDRLIPEYYEKFQYKRDWLALDYDLLYVEGEETALVESDLDMLDFKRALILSTCTGNSNKRWLVVGLPVE